MLESLLTSVNVDCRPRSFSSCVGLLCGGGEGGGELGKGSGKSIFPKTRKIVNGSVLKIKNVIQTRILSRRNLVAVLNEFQNG